MMWERIRSGVRWKPMERFSLAVRSVDLKEVKTVFLSFDPFHPDSNSLRMFWQAIASPRVRFTNPKVVIRTEIRNDRQPPFFIANLADGRRLVFKTAGMPEADMVMQFNRLLGNPERGKAGPHPPPTI